MLRQRVYDVDGSGTARAIDNLVCLPDQEEPDQQADHRPYWHGKHNSINKAACRLQIIIGIVEQFGCGSRECRWFKSTGGIVLYRRNTIQSRCGRLKWCRSVGMLEAGRRQVTVQRRRNCTVRLRNSGEFDYCGCSCRCCEGSVQPQSHECPVASSLSNRYGTGNGTESSSDNYQISVSNEAINVPVGAPKVWIDSRHTMLR